MEQERVVQPDPVQAIASGSPAIGALMVGLAGALVSRLVSR